MATPTKKNTVKAKFYGDENGKIDVKNGEQAEKTSIATIKQMMAMP